MKILINEKKPIPLLGHIAFGFIDRGTNLIQTRPISGCILNCIYCSVDEGPFSRTRVNQFEVDLNYFIKWAEEIAAYKKEDIQWHIDCAGEAMLYPDIVKLTDELRKIKGTSVISMETRGTLLTKEKIENMDVDRINISIDSMEDERAKMMAGIPGYDVEKVKDVCRNIIDAGIKLLIAPVWVPGINDLEIPKIIEFGKSLGAEFGIQKYDIHKFGRKVKGVKPVTFWKFYKNLEEIEKKYKINLKISPKDFGIHRTNRIPIAFDRFEIAKRAEVVSEGWIRNEMICSLRNRAIAVYDINNKIGDKINVKILRNNDNVYVGRRV